MDLYYSVKYSDRKTVTITVERDRSVVVKAPQGMPEEKIASFVESKKLWIYEKIKCTQKYSSEVPAKEFVSGETVLYLGRKYRLEIVKSDLEEIHFSGKFIVAAVSAERASEVFREWYKKQASLIIPERVERYAKSLGVTYNKVLISDLKYSWGACTPKNNLNFNWRLIKAPMFVVDYVVVHELVHFLELNHTPKFWIIVSNQISRYKDARNWLREYGAILENDF